MSTRKWTARIGAPVLAVLLAVAGADAQEGDPLSGFMLSGYGTIGYNSTVNQGAPGENFGHDFSAAVSPILLYDLSDDILLEAEFEFGLEGEETTTNLEYAQINYLGFENVQLTAGKFLTPFGLFSERLHPTWINKLPSMPLLYGHAHGGVAEGALLPVLSDLGLMGRLALPVGGSWNLDFTAYAVQGPAIVETAAGDATAGEEGADHAHSVRSGLPDVSRQVASDGDAHDSPFEIPDLAFGTNTTDNNDNKALGGRLGFVHGGLFEVYVSGFHAMADEGDFLDVTGANLAVEWRPGAFQFRGEGVTLWQEFTTEDAYETIARPGYYLEGSRRIGSFEPVVRWSHLLDTDVDGIPVSAADRQIAAGVNYWISPSVPVKAAFELNLDGDERVLVQWAYGF